MISEYQLKVLIYPIKQNKYEKYYTIFFIINCFLSNVFNLKNMKATSVLTYFNQLLKQMKCEENNISVLLEKTINLI